jgi:prevent-host-death family protein
MLSVTASEAKQGLAGVIEATKRGPVVIQRQKRDVAVVMSIEEYERLAHLNVAEFQRFCDQVGMRAEKAGLTEEKLTELLARAD